MEAIQDTFRLFVPLEKSVEMDANGDYIVQGIISSDDTDEQADSISPDGMDTSYFLEKGWIKWEHGNNPDQFIGEPQDVRVGRFKHPTLNKSINGVFIKGRLFANREMSLKAVVAIEDLQKSHSTRRVGWSIEGGVVERDRQTGKIIKSVLRNVVLTMNPVNTMTYAELVKSFTKGDEFSMTDNQQPETNVAEIGVQLGGLEKSIMHLIKKQGESNELIKSLETKVDNLSSENEELRKSLNQPQPRKGATGQRDYTTITRPNGGGEMTKQDVLGILEKSFEAGEMSMSDVIRYEMNGSLEQIALPASVKEKLGV
ncbi:hypothetical protein G9G53_22645 [Paenibacillus sp. EKM206P]|uniref:hypothetical protein n=1 Tax=Paenibacillus sp. EKM206P TaxID=1683674 RepID=UPI0013EC1D0F|nr:hypothetical protein [Paenibacillus sp. EKM206P]KAF6569090.1 hypothetical protein G9G53_22645 [Paenibacillus sp. EKM206P]